MVAEPGVKGEALEGLGEGAESGDGEGIAGEGEGIGEPFLLGGEDIGGAPEALADVAAELAGEHGEDASAEAIAGVEERGVGGVFAMADFSAGGVGLDVGAPDAEPWAEDLEGDAVDLAEGAGAHAAKAGGAAAEEIEEEGLDLIVGVMGEEEDAAAGLACGGGEEGVTGVAGGCLNGELESAGEGGNIGAAGDDGEAQPAGEGLDETGIGGSGRAAEAMIEVEDDEVAKAVVEKGVKERGGIDTAGDADEEAAATGHTRERKGLRVRIG